MSTAVIGEGRETAGAAGPVVVFDGVCRLCNGWVKFLLARPGAAQFRFAAMQGETGTQLLRAQGLDPADPTSFLFVDAAGAHTGGEAVVRLLGALGGAWRLTALARVLPRALREAGYRALARNRYRWFGKRAQCLLPTPGLAARFLP